MTDLNAPLKPRGKPTPQRHGAAGGSRASFGIGILAIYALIGFGANAALVSFGDEPLSAAEPIGLAQIQQPKPLIVTPAETETADTVNTRTESGVEIVYGTGEQVSLVEPSPPSVQSVPRPQSRPAESATERRLSEDGPKIISVRDPSVVGIGQPLEVAHLPDKSALEDTNSGAIPRISPNGQMPMDIYARPWSGAGGKRIALVIGGLGLSQTGTANAIEQLPPEVTLAFAPDGNSLNRWMRQARQKGHEILLQVPMEPFGYPNINPGPNTLRLASSSEANIERLHQSLASLTNYTGVMNYLGGRLATQPDAMRPVLSELADRGLLFLNDGSITAEVGNLATQTGTRYAQSNIVIDASQTSADIQKQLQSLEALAGARGFAVGTGSALSLTVTEVTKWANEAKKRGIEFVGVAAIARGNR
ncbi:MAG: divergent polysaccharide deacetylase family protein [Pseudomonadota bacterium]